MEDKSYTNIITILKGLNDGIKSLKAKINDLKKEMAELKNENAQLKRQIADIKNTTTKDKFDVNDYLDKYIK